MSFFTLLKEGAIHVAPQKKVIPAEEFSTLMSAAEVKNRATEEALTYRKEVALECEKIKEQAQKEGFEEGLKRWNAQIAFLEKEVLNVRKEMETTLVPLATAAVKKIIGKELELKPETIVDIVATALKTVSQHHRIAIYVNRADLEIVEEARGRLKEIFEHLHSMSISARDDVESGGCIIETEVGIINAQLSNQLQALEAAFHAFFQNHSHKELKRE